VFLKEGPNGLPPFMGIEVGDVFLKKGPIGLPPFRGIEIDDVFLVLYMFCLCLRKMANCGIHYFVF